MKNLIQRKKNKHTPSGYSLFKNCSFGATKNKLDRERKLRKWVLWNVKSLLQKFVSRFTANKNDENAFKPYNKVRDHCHYTGEIRGAAHSIWNLTLFRMGEGEGEQKAPPPVPVFPP